MVLLLSGLLLSGLQVAGPAQAKTAPPAESSPAFLPTDFAGWQQSGAVQVSSLPHAADSANSDVLKEYGFQQFEAATYSSGDGKLSVRAIRFEDASGAYGAFTFYRRPGSLPEQIGRGAAWDGSRALFWNGGILVDATFDRLTAMSTAQLRELAGDLPKLYGSANVAPSLPGSLPREDLSAGLTHYSLGVLAYSRSGGVLPGALLHFESDSAEAVTATYSTRDGVGNLTLVEFPTPQLAAARLREIDAFLKAGNTPQAAWPQPLARSNPDDLLTRRSGPIVAVTSGSLPPATARHILNQVNYQADVTWNKPEGYVSESAKVARLLLGIFTLIGVGGAATILLGLFLGGGRAALRVLRGKPASSVSETEIIRLHLDD